MPMPDYYKILQVDPLAEEEVIEAAYRRLARKYHPDVYAGENAAERMRELNLAYGVLGDPARRQTYDAAREREFAAQVQLVAKRLSGQQRAITREDLAPRAGAAAPKTASAAPKTGADHPRPPDNARRAAMHRMQSQVPSLKVSTGDWPAITPDTGRLPVAPAVVYRRPRSALVREEILNLGQGLLAVGLIGYPMVVALCWLPLQALWSALGLAPQAALIATLGAPVLPVLALCWWFGRRIRSRRL